MKTHRSLGFLAALLFTVGQMLVVSTSTVTVAQDRGESAAFQTSANA
jgi:hypothetical protein